MTAEREREQRSREEIERDAESAADRLEKIIFGSVQARAVPPAAAFEPRPALFRAPREPVMAPPSETSPNVDALDRRLAALEEEHRKLEGKFDRLETKFDKLTELVRDFSTKLSERLNGIDNRLTAIEGQLAAKAARTDLTPIETKLGTLDGRVANLPTTPAMIGLVMTAVGLSLGGAAGLAFTLFKIFKPG